MDAVATPPIESPPPRIRILPPELADQIAAGEVVERAASVVKELCENALDAGAHRVDVEIDAGGRRLVRVVDDGSGMTAEEARLALRRHATSKIGRAEDLWGLRTFGFRGEALPSIAAVSRLTVLTKTAFAPAGVRLTVEAGVETDAREAGLPDGTQIEVHDLFFNTPARQKFQKAESTETANVAEAVLRLALARPDVHFRLRVGGRVTLDLPPHRGLGDRVRAALARRGAGAVHEADGAEAGVKVRAFLTSPEEATTTARNAFLYVDGRFVRDRSLLHALALGYGELIERGRYPLAALFIEVPAGDVDVNVHPQKIEVRFARAQEVYGAVRHVVGAAVARAPWLADRADRPVRVYTLPPEHRSEPERGTVRASAPQGALPFRAASRAADADDLGPGLAPLPAAPATTNDGFFSGLHYIGQLAKTYLVCEAAGEMILVDQHAAHERVAFQRLRAAAGARAIRHQRLLFPVPVELDEVAVAAAGGQGEMLASLGFEVERFGPATLLVRAVPELLKDADPKPLLRDVLGQMGDGVEARSAQERIDHVLATMACHSVVRAGDVLGEAEVTALLGQLDDVDLRSHCPHGRPVLLRMPIGEIERRFGRA